MKSTSKTKKQFGFNLIELLLVFSIMSLISTSILATVKQSRVNARDGARKAEIKQIQNAMYLYYDKYNYYPAGSPNVALTGADLSTATGVGFMDQLYLDNFISKPISSPGTVGWVYYPNTGTAINISTRQGHCGSNIGTGVSLQFRFESGTSSDYKIIGGTWNVICFFP